MKTKKGWLRNNFNFVGNRKLLLKQLSTFKGVKNRKSIIIIKRGFLGLFLK